METYGYTNENGQTVQPDPYRRQQKILAALLGIFLGSFGANKFYLGYNKEGVIQILVNLVTCGVGATVPLIEGILYLTMSDQQFEDTYIKNKKPWF